MAHNWLTLTKGRKAADYAYLPLPTFPQNLAWVRSQGIEAVYGYIDGSVGSSNPSDKCITKLLLAGWLFNGVGFQAVFERWASRCLEGHTAGDWDGRSAVSDMRFLGLPDDHSQRILVAFDVDISSSNVAPAIGYWQGFVDAAYAGGYLCDAYGDKDFLDAIAQLPPKYRGTGNVQANARGWSWDWVLYRWRGYSANAQLSQQPEAMGFDIDIVLQPTTFYLGEMADPPVTPPQPPITGVDMHPVIISVTGMDAKFTGLATNTNSDVFQVEWTGPGSSKQVQARLAAMKAAGAKDLTLTLADFTNITLIGPLPADTNHTWVAADFFRVNG